MLATCVMLDDIKFGFKLFDIHKMLDTCVMLDVIKFGLKLFDIHKMLSVRYLCN